MAGEIAPSGDRDTQDGTDLGLEPSPARDRAVPLPGWTARLTAGRPVRPSDGARSGWAAATGSGRSTGPRTDPPSGRVTLERKSATACRSPVTDAIRTAGGMLSSARSSSSRPARPAGSQRTRALVGVGAASPTSSSRPPSWLGRTSAPAVIQRCRASWSVYRPTWLVETAASSSTPTEYPDGATGSAPGVETTSAGLSGTSERIPEADRAPETRTVAPGKALPSSSAVRSLPTRTDRRPVAEHSGQRQPPARAPHHEHCGTACAPWRASGPLQAVQRAAVLQRTQATTGRYPARGTWTRTGPSSSPLVMACHAAPGRRAAPAGPRGRPRPR